MMLFISRRVLAMLLSTIALLGYSSCGQKEPESIEDFQELLSELDSRNSEIMKKREEIEEILRHYNEKMPLERKISFTIQNGGELTRQQEDLLKEMIRRERDVSYRGLLRYILERNDEIRELREALAGLESRLPKPIDVKRGDTHHRLCLAYLTDVEGLSRAKAESLIDRVALVPDLVKGYQVWFWYRDGVFGSFVTQGSARVSPSRLARITRRATIEEAHRRGRDEAYVRILDSLRRDSVRDTVRFLPGDSILP